MKARVESPTRRQMRRAWRRAEWAVVHNPRVTILAVTAAAAVHVAFRADPCTGWDACHAAEAGLYAVYGVAVLTMSACLRGQARRRRGGV